MATERTEHGPYDEVTGPEHLEWLHKRLLLDMQSSIYNRLLLLPHFKKRAWHEGMISEVAASIAADLDEMYEIRYKNYRRAPSTPAGGDISSFLSEVKAPGVEEA